MTYGTTRQDYESQISPQIYARIGGLLYLIIIVFGIIGEAFVRNPLIVSGDATATAERIRASEFLWRVGIADELVLLICAIALTLVFYVLLRPVNKHLALLATLFNMVSLAVEAVSSTHLMATLSPLANANYLKAIDPRQLNALAYLSAKSWEIGFGVALVFFGCTCLILGYLIFKSGYLPRVIGVLMQIAGVSYLTNSFALILSPSLAHVLFPAILLPAFVGESSLCLWLLLKGVNVPKWNAVVSGG